MFPTFSKIEDFIEWTRRTDQETRSNPSIHFLVAYCALERYLRRTALALEILDGVTNRTARQSFRKCDAIGLGNICGNPKILGNSRLSETLQAAGIRGQQFKKVKRMRDGIAHGFDLGSKEEADRDAELLWKALRKVSELPFGEGQKEKRPPYFAWKRLPIRKRARARRLSSATI